MAAKSRPKISLRPNHSPSVPLRSSSSRCYLRSTQQQPRQQQPYVYSHALQTHEVRTPKRNSAWSFHQEEERRGARTKHLLDLLHPFFLSDVASTTERLHAYVSSSATVSPEPMGREVRSWFGLREAVRGHTLFTPWIKYFSYLYNSFPRSASEVSGRRDCCAGFCVEPQTLRRRRSAAVSEANIF